MTEFYFLLFFFLSILTFTWSPLSSHVSMRNLTTNGNRRCHESDIKKIVAKLNTIRKTLFFIFPLFLPGTCLKLNA